LSRQQARGGENSELALAAVRSSLKAVAGGRCTEPDSSLEC
jgi:hypothetical protein